MGYTLIDAIVLFFLDVAIPTPQVLALCSVVVWYSPAAVSCSDIIGYEVRFFSPQLALDSQNVTRRVGANQTFYIVQDEDRMSAIQEDIYVQVIQDIIS